jgi:hypothetical protein
MCVVQNFNQLEEAMKQDAREVLIIGKLANQFTQLMTEVDDRVRNDGLVRSFLMRIQHAYTICYRGSSRSVPVVLHRNAGEPDDIAMTGKMLF